MAEKRKTITESQLKTIVELISEIEFGSLSIIVQDGKIVQIDKIEKYRMKN